MVNQKFEIDMMASIGERCERVGDQQLTDSERFYRTIWCLEGEANGGSFHAFFYNTGGACTRDALRGLQVVGAHKMAAVFEAAILLFPANTVFEDNETRGLALSQFSSEQLEQLDRLSSIFTDYPDPLNELLKNYVEAHDEFFKGPRTQLEYWQSRRARGADTTPCTVTRKIDFEQEAQADRQFSSRSCPVCSYPSPDYRSTCKRCGFPHGRV